MMDSLEIIAACDLEVRCYSKVNEGTSMCVIKVKVSLTMAEYHSNIKIKKMLYSKITRLLVTRF